MVEHMVNGRTFMLHPLKENELREWLDISTQAALHKASFIRNPREFTEKDLQLLYVASAYLVTLATGCDLDFALELDDETERAPLVEKQNALNGITEDFFRKAMV